MILIDRIKQTMRRERHVRFWLPTIKKMAYPISKLEYMDTVTDKTIIAMDFTGLTDKKGKKIFEGDIRMERNEDDEGDIVDYFVCIWIKEVAKYAWLSVGEILDYIEDGYAIATADSGYFDDFDSSQCLMWNVIGNVFENPELIEI